MFAGIGRVSSNSSCLWVAVGGDTHSILYSTNGTSWQDTATGTSKFGHGRGIAYGTSSDGSCLWVAVGGNTSNTGEHNIIYSTDGISWQATATGTSKFGGSGGESRGIAYGTSSDGSCLWVAVGKGTHNILYSTNGTSWQATATGTSKFGEGGTNSEGIGIAYGTSSDGSCLWVAVGGDTYNILYSTNGTNWVPSDETDGLVLGSGVAFDRLLYGMSKGNYHPY